MNHGPWFQERTPHPENLPMPTTSIARSLAHGAALAFLALASLIAPVAAATLYALGGNAGPGGGQTGLYTMNAVTGVMTWVGSPHTAGSFDNTIYNGGLAYDPYTDRMYALGCDSSVTSALFLVNRNDASMIRIGYLGGSNPYSFCSGGLAFDVTTRRLFAVGDPGVGQATALFELDTNTGAATVLGGNGLPGTYLAGLGCDPQTGVLYANGFRSFDQNSGLFVLDKGNGAGTFVGYHGLTLGRKMNYSGPAIDPVTGTMYSFGSFSASQNNIYSVDKSSGLATSVAAESPNGVGVDGALAYAGLGFVDAGSPTVSSRPLLARPNPTSANVSFAFDLEREGRVSLALFDLAGRMIANLGDARYAAGPHVMPWDGIDARGQRVARGLYFAALRVDGALIGRTTVLVAR